MNTQPSTIPVGDLVANPWQPRTAGGNCALCAADLQRGRLLTTADLMA